MLSVVLLAGLFGVWGVVLVRWPEVGIDYFIRNQDDRAKAMEHRWVFTLIGWGWLVMAIILFVALIVSSLTGPTS